MRERGTDVAVGRPRPTLRGAVWTVARIAAIPLTAGCLLLGEDLTRRAPTDLILSACNFDIEDAYRCEGHKSSYLVWGMCNYQGVYLIEGSLSWRAEDGKVSESYTVEPVEFMPATYGAGDILFTATCDAEPYQAGSNANCLDAEFVTTLSSIPMTLLELVEDANPVAVGQFSEADLAEFPLQQDCAPVEPPKLRPKQRPQPAPQCETERAPALVITSPQANQVFDVDVVDGFELALQAASREDMGQVEIEWQKLDARWGGLDGLPELVDWSALPLTIGLTAGPGGAGDARYRVRVRPYDRDCERLWSFWQEFRTVNGGPVISSRGSAPSRDGARDGDGP